MCWGQGPRALTHWTSCFCERRATGPSPLPCSFHSETRPSGGRGDFSAQNLSVQRSVPWAAAPAQQRSPPRELSHWGPACHVWGLGAAPRDPIHPCKFSTPLCIGLTWDACKTPEAGTLPAPRPIKQESPGTGGRPSPSAARGGVGGWSGPCL